MSPQGAHSDETFRFFESIMMGALPLVETLPKLWFYETAPHFKSPWRDLNRTLSQVLNYLQTAQCRPVLHQVADYCSNILCPDNLANFLKERVMFRKTHRATNQKPLDEIRTILKQMHQREQQFIETSSK